MDQFWPNLQLLKAKIKKPWATAECDQIPKMSKIICFYVHTHVLKSEQGACISGEKKNYLVTRHSLTSNSQTRNTRNTGSMRLMKI